MIIKTLIFLKNESNNFSFLKIYIIIIILEKIINFFQKINKFLDFIIKINHDKV